MALAIDLFCGLGGWTEGLLAEGWDVIGFDIERHNYGTGGYPAQLVLQDVLTLHGRQFKDAALIVASPPCQEFSYMAMPWSKAKAQRTAILADPAERKRLTALFDACFRIQREAIEAAGHFIPLVVENVRGANKWVGRSRWNYGSFHLWGDVPALMPMTKSIKNNGGSWFAIANNTTSGHSKNPVLALAGQKVPGFRFGSGKSFQTASVEGTKTIGHANIRDGHSHTRHLTNQAKSDGVKQGGDWFNAEQPSLSRMTSSKSNARKAASAAIAKIPFALARHIARAWKPEAA